MELIVFKYYNVVLRRRKTERYEFITFLYHPNSMCYLKRVMWIGFELAEESKAEV